MSAPLTARQETILRLMRRNPNRHGLYEGADRSGKYGCGLHYLEYSGDLPSYEPLSTAEVDDLTRRGLIAPKWSDEPRLRYYRLATR